MKEMKNMTNITVDKVCIKMKEYEEKIVKDKKNGKENLIERNIQ